MALVVGLVLVLPAAADAAGTGAIEGTVTAEAGGALAGIEVCAEEISEEAFECEMTNGGGEYEVSGLPEGEYKVEFWPRELDYVRQYYNDKTTWSAANPVHVTAGTTQGGIDAVLESGATMRGVVTAAATGQPAAGVLVCAFSATAGGRCAESNGSGSYEIVGLAGGEYEVEFFPEGTGQNLLFQLYPSLVTVPAHGEKTGIDAALQAGGQILGTVRLAATGAPLAGVRVCLSEADFLESLGCLTTPASGAYRFYGLWNSSYKIVFSAASNEIDDPAPIVDSYPTQWWNGQPTFAAATSIPVAPPAIVTGIEAHLGPPPAVTTPVMTLTSTPTPVSAPIQAKATSKAAALNCKRGFVKRKVHGKQRCVKTSAATRQHRRPRHRKSA